MQQPVTLANWRSAPFNHWASHHVRELMPTADIANEPLRVRSIKPAPRRLELRVEPDTGEPLSFERFLAETDSDGIVILQRGRLIAEYYDNGMTPHTPHILMSVSKSMMGLLFGQLGIDAERQVADVVPEVAGTAYQGAT